MSLSKYHQKRKFEETPEPKGKVKKHTKILSFVVQEHHASHLHYDFRLEMDGVLKSWAVPKGPSMNPHDKHLAVHVEDHPYEYRKFHGVIPAGNYGAGTVSIWDSGTYIPAKESDDPEKLLLQELRKGEIKFILKGKKLKGEFVLTKFGDEDKNWLLIKKEDAYATWESIIKNPPKQKDKLEKIHVEEKSPMPHEIKPMLAELAETPFNDPTWIFETKWDGYRAIAEIHNGKKIHLYSRNNQDFTDIYKDITEALKVIDHDAVLDGEIVAFDKDGRASFQSMQDYRRNNHTKLVYYVFDLLYLNGYDIRHLPLIDRKSLLKKLLPKSQIIKFSNHIDMYGLQLFDLAKKQNLEGIIAKKKESPYRSTRSADWLKIKNIQMQEAIICGFTKPRGSREQFGALILGIHDNGETRYVGHTGGGFDGEKLRNVFDLLQPLVTDKSPFPNKIKTNTEATWVKPKLVCQVKFSEWTRDGLMRQPIFLGLRIDKTEREVKNEVPIKGLTHEKIPETKHVELSNLTKVFWPEQGYTKGDLVSYYDKIAPYILPYLKDRAQSLLRHPDGVNAEGFFQKDMDKAPKWTKTVPIYSEKDKKYLHWLVCNDRETLLYMAQLGCIEINPWSSRYQKKDNPDYMIIDLDPEDISFDEVISTAKIVKEVLDEIKADCFVKTSGKTGMHILVPLGAKYTFDQTKQFAEILANAVSRRLPHTTSIIRNPKKREKKVYIDFLQNRQGQTITAPYSLRPVPMANVSTPLHWDEVKKGLLPTNFTIQNIFKRLDKVGDIWKPLLTHKGIDMLKSLNLLEKIGS